MAEEHMRWTVAADFMLRTLWAEQLSAQKIGRRMGTTKNSVVGRAYRLHLPARPSPIRRAGEAPAPRRQREHPATALPKLASVPDTAPPSPPPPQRHGGLSVLRIARPATIQAPPPPPRPVRAGPAAGCLWPTWTQKDAAYRAALRDGKQPSCGAPVRLRTDKAGETVRCVYCAEHATLAFTRRVPGYATDKVLAELAGDAKPSRKEL
nr:GcrA family cell cycle regulator [uncultured Rhodopila sp.]